MLHTSRLLAVTALAFAVIGLFVRIYPFPGYPHIGLDEHVYETYVNQLSAGVSYPSLIRSYFEAQTREPVAFLPPTRVTFLSLATLTQRITGQATMDAVRTVSLIFGILTVFVAGTFAWRAGGLRTACGVVALMSTAPLQIHLCHRALIDGFFAFWALLCLWMLWEALRQPGDRRWLLGYGAALGLLVLTKENAAFVYIGILGLLVLNRWCQFGRITLSLLVTTVVAPAVAVIILITLCGGPESFVRTYLLNIQKSYVLDYAITTGDGPWYRYLLDLFALSPLLMVLACAGMLQTRRADSWQLFLAVFVFITYVVMANLRYGMNLRYGAIWDLPLRCFVVAQLTYFASRFPERMRAYVLPAMILTVAAVDLRQYFIIFVRAAVYDPIPQALLEAVGILK